MKYSIKVTVFLLLAGITTFFLQREEQSGKALDGFNQGYLDWLAANAAGKIEEPEVTLVRIEPEDLEKDNLDPRLDWAVILRGLETYDPQAVGLVPTLNWETEDPLAERVLNRLVEKMPKMVLGSVLAATAPEKQTPVPVDAMTQIANITGDVSALPEAKHLVEGPSAELLVNGVPAFTEIELAEDTAPGPNGIRLPLLARVGDKVVASFILQMILSYENLEPDQVTVTLAPSKSSMKIGDKFDFPIDSQGNLTVYHGLKDAFPELSIADLTLTQEAFQNVPELQEKVKDLLQADEATMESLKRHAIIVGYDQESLREFELPTGQQISRTELLAMALATIQSGRHITYWPQWVLYTSWGLLGLVGLFFLKGSRMRGAGGGILALILYAIVTMLYFQTALSWTPPLPAVGICAVIFLAGLLLPGSGKKKASSEKEASS